MEYSSQGLKLATLQQPRALTVRRTKYIDSYNFYSLVIEIKHGKFVS